MFLRIRLLGIIEAQKGTSPVLPTGPVASFLVGRGRNHIDERFLNAPWGLLQALFAASNSKRYA